ncbi:MAG TPA: hypothetical protein VGR71_05075 [Nitrospira sp.]|nr:hypothetical protein [Nitrospira sp.]
MSEKDEWDGPLDASQAREQILREYRLAAEPEVAPEAVASTIAPPYIDPGPQPGTANVRIKQDFPTHVFVIPGMGLELSQTAWTNVPAGQVAEITQIAAENQILLEVEEASA